MVSSVCFCRPSGTRAAPTARPSVKTLGYFHKVPPGQRPEFPKGITVKPQLRNRNGERSRPGCCSARPRAELWRVEPLAAWNISRASANREGAVPCARGGRAPPIPLRSSGSKQTPHKFSTTLRAIKPAPSRLRRHSPHPTPIAFEKLPRQITGQFPNLRSAAL